MTGCKAGVRLTCNRPTRCLRGMLARLATIAVRIIDAVGLVTPADMLNAQCLKEVLRYEPTFVLVNATPSLVSILRSDGLEKMYDPVMRFSASSASELYPKQQELAEGWARITSCIRDVLLSRAGEGTGARTGDAVKGDVAVENSRGSGHGWPARFSPALASMLLLGGKSLWLDRGLQPDDGRCWPPGLVGWHVGSVSSAALLFVAAGLDSWATQNSPPSFVGALWSRVHSWPTLWRRISEHPTLLAPLRGSWHSRRSWSGTRRN